MEKKKKILIGVGIAAALGLTFIIIKNRNAAGAPSASLQVAQSPAAQWNGQIVTGDGNAVWFIQDGFRHLLMDWTVGAKYGLTKDKLMSVDLTLLNSIPAGNNLAA